MARVDNEGSDGRKRVAEKVGDEGRVSSCGGAGDRREEWVTPRRDKGEVKVSYGSEASG